MSGGRGLGLRVCVAIAGAVAALIACAHTPSAAAATAELRVVCAQPSGFAVHLPLGGACFRGEQTVQVSPGPTVFCLLPVLGYAVRVGAPTACGSPALTLTVPSVSDTFFCANMLGLIRHVTAATCLRGESLRVVRRGNQAPTDITLSNATVPENHPAGTIVGALSATDPDPGDSLSYSLVEGAGSTDNARFAIAGNVLSTTTSFDYEAQNAYIVRIQASDGNGGTFEKSLPIAVTNLNEAPSLATLPAVDVVEGRTAAVDLAAFVSDPDQGDSETLALAAPAPAHGSVAVDDTGTATYTADVLDCGPGHTVSDAFGVTVTDAGGLSAGGLVTMTIHCLDHPPVATADAVSVSSGSTATLDLLANDSDPDAQTLHVLAPGPYVTVHGSGSIDADGTTTYAPAAGFCGHDSFTYQATDGELSSAPANVDVTVLCAPDAPAAPTAADAGGGAVRLAWSPPNDNGLPISGYVLRYQPGNGLVRVGASSCGAVSCATTVAVAPCTATAFTLAATNAVGESPESAASTTVTPLVAPGAPANLSLSPGAAALAASWSAPGSGCAADSYEANAYDSNGSLVAQATTTATGATLTGLTTCAYGGSDPRCGRSYFVSVRAHNAAGWGPGSAFATGVPLVSFTLDNIPGIFAAKGCTGCHSGAAAPPNLSPSTAFPAAVAERTLIYTCPGAGACPFGGHPFIFSSSSSEFATLARWVSDGQRQ